MDNLNKIEIAARNKANYLKAKEAFNNKKVDECILFYAADHEVKSKQSEKGRDGIQRFLEGLHQSWPDIQITDRIYLNDFCCPMPPKWAELSNHVCSNLNQAEPQVRHPPSLILAAWSESSKGEKRQRLFEQLLFAYRHGTIGQARNYLMSLDDSDWHKMH